MGWCLSPPNFSACAKTVSDLDNALFSDPITVTAARHTPHRLDDVSESPPPTSISLSKSPPPLSVPVVFPSVLYTLLPYPPPTNMASPFKKPISYWYIYVDCFCGLAQGNQWRRWVVKRLLFQALGKAFCYLGSTGTPFRKDPASIKKL